MSGYPSLPSADSLSNGIRNSKREDTGSASILVTWHSVPTVGPRGIYHVYLTPADEFTSSRRSSNSETALNAMHKQRRWSEHSIPGGQNSTVVHHLRTGQPYFLLMSAQNRHGRSPLSSLSFFRTADGKCT
ncbi:unnamed protein product [Rodentolepis nana]|uniref:Fibronectin type-III domain-containing protein n=1 Tax=Rodentolepis nana TaxID=102285 RepID=A0A0R3TIK1_RODNA|nr:unnamed protein product [Rodentolepis nana]